VREPLPPGFGIALDRSLRSYDGELQLLGGMPVRAIKLTEAGRDAFLSLRAGRWESEAARMLARRLLDAGLAHPRPPRGATFDVTVVVPVRDRAAMLDRCLAALGDRAPLIVVDDGSEDHAAVKAICKHHSAQLIRHETPRGAAAARNSGFAATESELVAFVDSDCVPDGNWLPELVAHFADPVVGAVAPRIRAKSSAPPGSAHALFTSGRCPLDMGTREGPVVPGSRIPFAPTAALVVRRKAIDIPFDPTLHCGEDVDLVWRLHDQGWSVRYVPNVTVAHEEPATWRGLLQRRFRYGTSVAPLAQRHPGRLAHVVVHPWTLPATAFALAGRPVLTAAMTGAHASVLARRLRGTGIPPGRALTWAASGVVQTAVGNSRAARRLAAPILFAAIATRATRRGALLLLASSAVEEWVRTRPRLDPIRWAAADLAEDVAYGLGVWHGCLARRTFEPIRPTLYRSDSHDNHGAHLAPRKTHGFPFEGLQVRSS
jgi:mycofactocin system glycosyltransferase